MRGLRLYLAPFAPDTSGAAAVFFAMGALVVILDAGGCAGNICAFDEPRWGDFARKNPAFAPSAIFSAGLRDMDAIMGRDELLINKLAAAAQEIKATFVALIGTPVPSVIGTDLLSLKHLIEKKIGLPTVVTETDGTKHYDEGISRALIALLKTFAPPRPNFSAETKLPSAGVVGLWGVTPLDVTRGTLKRLRSDLTQNGWSKVVACGIDDGIQGIALATRAERNLVLTAAAIPAARYLERTLQVPFALCSPYAADVLPKIMGDAHVSRRAAETWQRILIVGEQIQSNALREELQKELPHVTVVCGTWFMQHAEYAEPQDVIFREESVWQDFVRQGDFDCIIADVEFKKALPFYEKIFVDWPHYAVSGQR